MGSKGLARFRSAPATWLDALLDPSDSDDVFKLPNQSLLDNFDTPDLFTQNSSPTGPGSDTSYFSSYQGGGTGYEFTPSPNSSGSTSSSFKRPRQDTFSSILKEEDQSEHLERGLSGLMDPDMEKLLEASVPCRVRAKRGCATHPRSIAERVRRTRISDRIRKLQDLVPNMEKQVNTSDMLEEAVEYVKLLQRQIQVLLTTAGIAEVKELENFKRIVDLLYSVTSCLRLHEVLMELTEQQKNCTCMPKE